MSVFTNGDVGDHRAGHLTNYVAYRTANGRENVGALDLTSRHIQPLTYASGTPLRDLYEVIAIGESNIVAAGDPFPLKDVKLLAPISGRDILCVGKNYAEHAQEFHSSGFDSSDKVAAPTHPVIFTKRFTSIIADGEDIFPHPDFTESLDFEGEIGLIIGKAGFRISESDAMEHVWGYTIINDMTARERQRDHKQFYIGKSPDTFCPMGPIAVPASKLDTVLRLQTTVNGEKRQDATTKDLIFSIPFLIKTLSEGQTIQPGDVLATGTPAGVGIGKKPPVFLHPGDEVSVSINGLGTLTNKIAPKSSRNDTISRIEFLHQPRIDNSIKSELTPSGLKTIHNKNLYHEMKGSPSSPPILFIHGLGGSSNTFSPLISALQLEEKYALHLFDLEGHGQSPTDALSTLSIRSFTSDASNLLDHAKIEGGLTVIAHSMGCYIALRLAASRPSLVAKMILLGPPPMPLPETAAKANRARAAVVRQQGMWGVTDAVSSAGTSQRTKDQNQVGLAAVRMSLLGQDPEGYSKACTALATATEEVDVKNIRANVRIITGSEDRVSPAEACENLKGKIKKGAKVKVLDGVGHWAIYEDLDATAAAVQAALE